MSRELDSSLVTEITSNVVRLVWFVKLELDAGTIYVHDGIGTITWGGNDWLGLGDFGGIQSINESEGVMPNEVKLTLSGIDSDTVVDTDFTNTMLTTNFFLRPVTIYIGAFDTDNGGLVADPDAIWKGKIDTADISLGTENAVVLTCESDFILWERSNGAVFSDAHHQSEVQSGDLYFEFLTDVLQSRSVMWGGRPVSGGGGNTTVPRNDGLDEFLSKYQNNPT